MARDLNGPLTVRTVLLTVVLLALLAVVPLAHARPPDPLWIPGIYDAADLDDSVVVVTSLDGRVSEAVAVVHRGPPYAVVGLAAPPFVQAIAPLSTPARAPPTF